MQRGYLWADVLPKLPLYPVGQVYPPQTSESTVNNNGTLGVFFDKSGNKVKMSLKLITTRLFHFRPVVP
jgi:hypothetical protein